MKLTKSKLKQIIKEETTRGLKEEVIDLGKYKAKKEREGMSRYKGNKPENRQMCIEV